MNMVFNGVLLRQDEINLPFNDRAFCYGDGLFETIIYRNGRLAYWSDHFHRMSKGMSALSMQAPEGFDAIETGNQIRQLLVSNAHTDTVRVRLQVWRQPGGLYTPLSAGVNYMITSQPCTPPKISMKERALFYDAVPVSFSAISAFKTCNALPYVLAGISKTKAGADDMILLDGYENVSECLASNLFWTRGNAVYTPSLLSGCIDGVMRKQLIQVLKTAGIAVEEGLFPKAALLRADRVFCCNVAGIEWIRQVEQTPFASPDRLGLEKLLAAGIQLPGKTE
jgi:branched-chain amino acid aminotransferase/4-amino-4-deoxychorismate lyase